MAVREQQDGGERPVVIIGASGFLGPALSRAFGDRIAGRTYVSHSIEGGLPFDIRSTPVQRILDALPRKLHAALILAGVTNVDACARDPEGTGAINVAGVVRVVDELRALGVVPVFTSSDAVFDGTHASWREDEEVRPILTYGSQKLAVERHLGSLPPPWLAMRLPKLLSDRRNPCCILSSWIEALGRDETILCATDQYFTPAEAGDASRVMLRLLDAGENGLFHLGGPERLSRRELLQAVLDEYRRYTKPLARIKECSLRDIPVFQPRPLDSSMTSMRLPADCRALLRPASEIARLAVRDYFAVTKQA